MTDRAAGFVRQFALAFRGPDGGTDADLLARFAAGRDGDAFAELVRRHGPMVRGVGRRIVRDPHAADDVFQATFLVLARRAAGVRDPGRLANWLYGVAVRTAREAKRAAAVRRAKEAEAAARRDWVTTADPDPPDVRAVLDAELVRLPEVYRTAIVLCDLEGLSRADAARRLGWSEGTLSGRLARARALLGRRLAKSGLAAAGLAAGLTPTAAEGVPAALLDTITRAAVLVAAGHGAAGVVPAAVLELTRGVRTVMLVSKLKVLVAGTMLAAAAAGTGTADRWSAVGASPQAPPPASAAPRATPPAAPEAPPPLPPKPVPSDADRIAQLERERAELMKKLAELQDRLAVVERQGMIARQREAEARQQAEQQAEAARKTADAVRAAMDQPLATPPRTSALPLRSQPPAAAAPSLPTMESWQRPPPPRQPQPPQPTPAVEPLPVTPPIAAMPVPTPVEATPLLAPTAYAPPAKPRPAGPLVIKTYPVGDLLKLDVEQYAPVMPGQNDLASASQLIALIQSMVDPEAWQGEGRGAGAVVYFGGKKVLVVRQTPEVHKQVAQVIDLLRAEPAPAPASGAGDALPPTLVPADPFVPPPAAQPKPKAPAKPKLTPKPKAPALPAVPTQPVPEPRSVN